jgi:hypothetical protein
MLAPSAIRCLRLLKTPELLLKVSTPDDWASACKQTARGQEGTGSVTADRYVPGKQDPFSFGIWTVGWLGVDVFVGATRPAVPSSRSSTSTGSASHG